MRDIIRKYQDKFNEKLPSFNITEEQAKYIEKEVVKAVNGDRGVITYKEIVKEFSDKNIDDVLI